MRLGFEYGAKCDNKADNNVVLATIMARTISHL